MDIIISPVITEKSMNNAGRGRFTFKVHKFARKEEIRREIENKFKVNVIDIATMNVKGKLKRTGQKRMENQTQGYKKAIVSLKAGQKIDLFEAGEKK